ncbi:RNA polymerase factor sigma-54 [Bavariicoccus seileri]|uniref:RNA polymerase factor sigma-54 n=1 Tax=Bavariicoccus seileri TaxID=549685 RepID=UPI003F8F6AB2
MLLEHMQKQKLKQDQKLVMTQQLQQSVQLLQYSDVELEQFLALKSSENPFLQVSQPTEKEVVSLDTYQSHEGDYSGFDQDKHQQFLEQLPQNSTETLLSHLISQVDLYLRQAFLRDIVLYLLDFINDDGYFTGDIDEVAQMISAKPIEVLDALTLIQMFDPSGVGARDLQECLVIQIQNDDMAPKYAKEIITKHFDLFTKNDKKQLMTLIPLDEADYEEVIDYIKGLNPIPGAQFGAGDTEYLIPEISIKKVEESYQIKYLKGNLPRVSFNHSYYADMFEKSREDANLKDYLKQKESDFNWLQKSLTKREQTVMLVGKTLFELQTNFFKSKGKDKRPLGLKEIATATGLNVSTISRTLNSKSVETDFGVFPMKDLLAKQVTEEGKSDSEVKNALKKVIQEEPKDKPYSDAKLAKLLEDKGISIKRRTVTKYRRELNILASKDRSKK